MMVVASHANDPSEGSALGPCFLFPLPGRLYGIAMLPPLYCSPTCEYTRRLSCSSYIVSASTIHQTSSLPLTISSVGVLGSSLRILFLSAFVTSEGVMGTQGEKGWYGE